jgi:hypothetical protein
VVLLIDLQHPVDDEERQDPDWHVQQEDPAPAVDTEQRVLPGERAADQRAEHARGAEDGEEIALVLGALTRRDDVAGDGQRERERPPAPIP